MDTLPNVGRVSSCVVPDGAALMQPYAGDMDLAITVTALGSFFALVLAWVSLPHGAEVARVAPAELHSAPRAA